VQSNVNSRTKIMCSHSYDGVSRPSRSVLRRPSELWGGLVPRLSGLRRLSGRLVRGV